MGLAALGEGKQILFHCFHDESNVSDVIIVLFEMFIITINGAEYNLFSNMANFVMGIREKYEQRSEVQQPGHLLIVRSTYYDLQVRVTSRHCSQSEVASVSPEQTRQQNHNLGQMFYFP